MAAGVRSVSQTTYASRSNTTLTAPTGIANNDVLLILFIIGAGSPPTPTPPTGFSALTGFPTSVTDGSFIVKSYAWYKIANGESGNYVITHTAASSQAFMYAITGGDTTTPVNPNATIATGTGATSTATGLTTAVDGSLVIFFEHDWGDAANSLSGPSGTTPTFTKRTTNNNLIYVADGVLSTAGTTGSKSILNNNIQPSPWMASLIAIAASTGGASGKLFRPPLLNGLSVGGPFFANPLG